MSDALAAATSYATPRRLLYPRSADGYELREQIGKGTSATVYRAWCTSTRSEVAIKIIDLEWFQKSLEEIWREVQVMSLSQHPNVVPYSTSFILGHDLWVIMPLISGGDLQSFMHILFPSGLPENYVKYMLFETTKAVEYFHANAQVHRDIKAANILLDTNGEILLTDYGMMGWMVEGGLERKQRQTFVGTPCWMAPEVMEQTHGYNQKADIWSLGITAIEIAQGHPPYGNFPPMKVLIKTLQNPPPTLDANVRDKFSQMFKDFIAFCLVKDPTQRPTATQILNHPFFKNVRKPVELPELIASLPPLGSRGQSQRDLYRQLQRLANGNVAMSGIFERQRRGGGWDFSDDEEEKQVQQQHQTEMVQESSLTQIETKQQDVEEQQVPVQRPSLVLQSSLPIEEQHAPLPQQPIQTQRETEHEISKANWEDNDADANANALIDDMIIGSKEENDELDPNYRLESKDDCEVIQNAEVDTNRPKVVVVQTPPQQIKPHESGYSYAQRYESEEHFSDEPNRGGLPPREKQMSDTELSASLSKENSRPATLTQSISSYSIRPDRSEGLRSIISDSRPIAHVITDFTPHKKLDPSETDKIMNSILEDEPAGVSGALANAVSAATLNKLTKAKFFVTDIDENSQDFRHWRDGDRSRSKSNERAQPLISLSPPRRQPDEAHSESDVFDQVFDYSGPIQVTQSPIPGPPSPKPIRNSVSKSKFTVVEEVGPSGKVAPSAKHPPVHPIRPQNIPPGMKNVGSEKDFQHKLQRGDSGKKSKFKISDAKMTGGKLTTFHATPDVVSRDGFDSAESSLHNGIPHSNESSLRGGVAGKLNTVIGGGGLPRRTSKFNVVNPNETVTGTLSESPMRSAAASPQIKPNGSKPPPDPSPKSPNMMGKAKSRFRVKEEYPSTNVLGSSMQSASVHGGFEMANRFPKLNSNSLPSMPVQPSMSMPLINQVASSDSLPGSIPILHPAVSSDVYGSAGPLHLVAILQDQITQLLKDNENLRRENMTLRAIAGSTRLLGQAMPFGAKPNLEL